MTKRFRKHVLEMLSRNLENFFPELKGYFMCPTCLRKIPLQNRDEISVAHIVPKAAGGRSRTYLCRQCNSSFGSRQDKWFGEFVRLARDSTSSILSTAIQDGYFHIDGHRVNGYWRADGDKNFTFYIDDRRNSPTVSKLMDQKFRGNAPGIKLKVPLPILRNERFIKVGFLTAGYLKWFAQFGYSWVLQKHLDPVRQQIQCPDEEIITANYVASLSVDTLDPWIAFVPLRNRPVIAFGYFKQMAIFPPRYEPGLYSKLGTFKDSVDMRKIRSIGFSDKPVYGAPVMVLQDHNLMIAPDLSGKQKTLPEALQFRGDGDKPNILRRISDEEYNNLRKRPDAIVHHIRLDDRKE